MAGGRFEPATIRLQGTEHTPTPLRPIHIHSFIHFGHFYSAPSSPILLRGAPDYSTDNCIGVSRRSAQATVGKGLSQGPYMADRAGVEPTTLRLKAIDSTKAPPCPRNVVTYIMHIYPCII